VFLRRFLLLLSIGGGAFVLFLFFWGAPGESMGPGGSDPGATEVPLSVPGQLADAAWQLQARTGVVIHVPSGKILAERDALLPVPIASITKLMGAMVALDEGVNLDAEVTIPLEEYTVGGNLRIAPGIESVTVRDLLYASITGSANNAANALARSTGLSTEEFVAEMNRHAVSLGLETMTFDDPSGLSPRNMGSAYDVARMASIALQKYPIIRDAASRDTYAIVTRNTAREHVIRNPNTLFQRATGKFFASKTGYLNEALYCVVLARDTPKGLFVSVTLGHPWKEGGENEAIGLLDEGEGRFAGLATAAAPKVH
jgi:serine-type D-Ala-D-Ala endopeptidase (penicillin-binding protein 7)